MGEDWKRSRKGNLFQWTPDGVIVVFERSDGRGYGLMRTAGDGEQPTFCPLTFVDEQDALEAVDAFIAELENAASPW